MRSYPDVDLRIHASPEPVDFFRSDTDVEIRYGNSDWAKLVVTQLLEDVVTPLCSPTFYDEIRARSKAERLAGVPLIVSERALMGWSSWFRTMGLPPQHFRGPRFDRGYLALQAAALGLGVALESTVFATACLAEKSLIRVFDDGDVVLGAHTLVFRRRTPLCGRLRSSMTGRLTSFAPNNRDSAPFLDNAAPRAGTEAYFCRLCILRKRCIALSRRRNDRCELALLSVGADHDRQTVELQIRAALLNPSTALGAPETRRVA